eukprot:Nitzschia sp. Nitz4//scaffold7_size249615//61207//64381//NITZ4_001155-RA/size249615-augustus-gene-0.231-mRNA-1//1//CDS//3329558376//4972//frame0
MLVVVQLLSLLFFVFFFNNGQAIKIPWSQANKVVSSTSNHHWRWGKREPPPPPLPPGEPPIPVLAMTPTSLVASNRMVERIFNDADSNHDGSVDFEEVYELVLKTYIHINRSTPLEPPNKLTVSRMFRYADKSRNGSLDRDEFLTLINVLGERAVARVLAQKLVTWVGAPLLATYLVHILSTQEWLPWLAQRLIPDKWKDALVPLVTSPEFARTVLIVVLVKSLGAHFMATVNWFLDLSFGNDGTEDDAPVVEKSKFQDLSAFYHRSLASVAATHRLRTQLEAQVVAKPTQWENWQAKDWEATALNSVGASKLSRAWMALSRMATLAVLGSPMLVLYPLSYVSKSAQDATWSYALWGIEKAGPTWIKLVQWATTRQDLFSPEFCQYFGKLRDETEGHSWRDTQAILEQELGSAVKALELEQKPIGSGCIAQVYRGRLVEPTPAYPAGTKVAIKVQHPGIWRKVCVDFYILRKFADWLEELPYLNLEYLSLSDTVRQFRDVMLPQLDLNLEAGHLRRFNQDFKNDDRVIFPRALDELTTTRVLTETFCEGTPILEYTKEGTPKEERKQLAMIGLETTLKMIFLNDFVHGDLHPGNILVTGKYPNLKMVMLDCGLVLEMGPDQHVNLVKVLGAFTKQDGRLAGQLMVDMHSESQATPIEIERFLKGIEQICIVDKDTNFIDKVGDYITDICYLACVNRVKLESAFVNAALAVEIMEGLASSLHADMNVKEVALPLVFKAELMHRLGFR